MEILRGSSGDTGTRKIGLTSGTDTYSQKKFVHWPINCKLKNLIFKKVIEFRQWCFNLQRDWYRRTVSDAVFLLAEKWTHFQFNWVYSELRSLVGESFNGHHWTYFRFLRICRFGLQFCHQTNCWILKVRVNFSTIKLLWDLLKLAQRSFASKSLKSWILTRSCASRFNPCG